MSALSMVQFFPLRHHEDSTGLHARKQTSRRDRVVPGRWRTLLRATGVVAMAYAASALTLAAGAWSPQTPLAAETLTAEHTQDLALALAAEKIEPPQFHENLSLILPITSRSSRLEALAVSNEAKAAVCAVSPPSRRT